MPGDPPVAPLRWYADLLDHALSADVVPPPRDTSPATLFVEGGVVYAAALRDPRRVNAFDPSPAAATLVVVDRLGHRRPAYRGLLVYACLQALRLGGDALPHAVLDHWEAPLRRWCDTLEADAAAVNVCGAPAARGDAVTAAAWAALALHVGGRRFGQDAWIVLSADTFTQLARGQRPSGAFLNATTSDNPEPWWYHELVLLHAAGSYAAQTGDPAVTAAVTRAAEFHQNETQPDHATSQPWGLFPLIRNPVTCPLADQILHAATALHPAGLDGVSLMLVADALYCLRLSL